ncbi:MAG: hypothetical protein IJ512_02010 [Ruminococcus sp.]|nr:hypothetical protein [Ruminococcus sp.]
MNEKTKNLVTVCLMAALLFGTAFWCWIKEADAYTSGERRTLAQFPKLTAEAVRSGDFMEDFEEYTVDQFPLREQLRSLKAFTALKILRQQDNHGVYEYEGHLSRNGDPVSEPMLTHAAERFQYLYENYLEGTNVNLYFSVIPDKNYYLAEESRHLSTNHRELVESMQSKLSFMSYKYIDVSQLLEAEDYYRTDTHWKQECITDVADHFASGMDITLEGKYTTEKLDIPFYGVYSGQYALPSEPDGICYLTSDTLSRCIVTSFSTGSPRESVLYNFEKAEGKDPYEFFLSGSEPLLTIENPHADTDRELVLFRDSFGSSLAPLLAEGYAKITLVDIRYMQSSMLGNFIDFEQQDVLFLYSDTLLNNSLALR